MDIGVLQVDKVLERKAKWCAHVMRQEGLPGTVSDGMPTGTNRCAGYRQCDKLE